jgi:hypothetical protein
MNGRSLVVLIGLGVAIAAPDARAQESDLAVEGPGYPLGPGSVIHPVLGAELGVTNNVFYENGDETPRASGLLRLLASAAIASRRIEPGETDPLMLDDIGDEPAEPAPQKVQFRLGGGLRYDEYLSPESHVRTQRTLAVDIKGDLVAGPEAVVAFLASDHLVRDTRPTNFESDQDTNRIANHLMLGLKWQPGGRTLNAQLKWENQLDIFEDPDQRFANRMVNAVHVRSEWEFFPYTKAFADVSYGFINGLGGMDYKRSAQPIRGGVGIATSITEIFTVKAHAGWAYAAYAGGASYSSPVLGGEVGYRYAPTGRVVVAYQWDHRDSINADYYSDHGLSGRVDHQLTPKIVGSARGEIHWRGYRGVNESLGGGTTRDDFIFAVGARAQYVVKDWMAIVGDYRTEVDQTSFMYSADGFSDDPSYVRHEVTAGVRAAF